MKHEICHLDSKGKYLKSFKTFKSYNDFAIDHNGRIYCAPLASSVNPFLVDVLDESGNLLYSFGTPIRKFEKFSDSFLNNTKIVCDGKSITILFITIALVQQYDLNGKLVRECTFKELPDIKNKEEKMNLNQIKNMIPGKTPISHLFDTIYYDNGAYYVLRNRDNGIEIIKLDSFLNIERRFTYSDINESLYLSLDFIVGDEGGKPIFYIARMLPIARIENISPL